MLAASYAASYEKPVTSFFKETYLFNLARVNQAQDT
jgi:hypothetical protein